MGGGDLLRPPAALPQPGAAAERGAAGRVEIKTGEKVFSPNPSSISGSRHPRRCGSRPTKRKGGAWGGNTFSSPTLLQLSAKLTSRPSVKSFPPLTAASGRKPRLLCRKDI